MHPTALHMTPKHHHCCSSSSSMVITYRDPSRWNHHILMIQPRIPLPTRGDGKSMVASSLWAICPYPSTATCKELWIHTSRSQTKWNAYKDLHSAQFSRNQLVKKNRNNRHPVTHEKRQLWPTAGVTLRHNSQFHLVTISSLLWQALVKLLRIRNFLGTPIILLLVS